MYCSGSRIDNDSWLCSWPRLCCTSSSFTCASFAAVSMTSSAFSSAFACEGPVRFHSNRRTLSFTPLARLASLELIPHTI